MKLKMSSPTSPAKSRAEKYRNLAMQAVNAIAELRCRAERYAEEGDQELAAEYQRLTREAIVRAERYLVLADFAERNSMDHRPGAEGDG